MFQRFGGWFWLPVVVAAALLAMYVVVTVDRARDHTERAGELGEVRYLSMRAALRAEEEAASGVEQSVELALADAWAQRLSLDVRWGRSRTPLSLAAVDGALRTLDSTARARVMGRATADELLRAADATTAAVDAQIEVLSGESRAAFARMRLVVSVSVVALATMAAALGSLQVRTARRNARIARTEREQHALMEQLVEASPNAIIIVSPGGAILAHNPAALQFTGYTADELSSLGAPRLFPTIDQPAAERLFAAAFAGGEAPPHLTSRLARRDGLTVDVEVHAVPMARDARVTSVLIEFVDVSARLAAERELAALTENAPVAILTIDAQGTVLSANQAVARTFGWEPAELVGQPLTTLMVEPHRTHHQEYVDTFVATGRPSTAEGLVINRTRETKARRRDGAEFAVEVMVNELPSLGGQRRFIGIVSDIEARKETEERLIVAEKNAALATLLSGVAHDFNNVLTIIMGGVSLARIKTDERDHWLGLAEAATERAVDLVRQLLTYSRERVPERTEVDVGKLVREALPLLRETVDRRIAIEVSAGSGPLTVQGEEAHLQQVFLNIVVNACHAVGQRLEADPTLPGRVDVNVERVVASDGAEEVAITVEDNGAGIAPNIIGRIFDPFFTTKPVGQGTGLGLSTSYATVKAHGGRIDVRSTLGLGSRFVVHLPALASMPVGPQPGPAGGPVEVGTPRRGRLLVAEDEEAIRAYVESVLGRAGYEVATAIDGTDAVRQAGEGGFDLVLLDLNLPGLNGWQVLERLRALPDAPPVLMMSGHGAAADARLHAARGLLPKPFTADQLLDAVRGAVQTPPR